MGDGRTLFLAGGAVLLAGVFVAVAARLASAKAGQERLAFAHRCAALGLQPATAGGTAAKFHWLGDFQGQHVVAGYYAGGTFETTSGAQKGVLLMMEVGALPGGAWGVEFEEGQARPYGRGEGREEVERLLSPEVVAAARAIPYATLFPADHLLEGSLQDVLVRGRWAKGWHGLAIRSLYPLDSSEQDLRQGLAQLLSLRAAVRLAAGQAP